MTPVRDGAPSRLSALVAAVTYAGGVVRRTRMVAEGFSQRVISDAVAIGALQVIRRVWLSLPAADTYLVSAARAGVVVSCVTRARRLGLWVPDDDLARKRDPATKETSHVAAPPHAGRVSVTRGTRVHRATPLVARDPHALEDVIENVIAVVCSCHPFEAALAIVESALNKGLVEKQALLRLPFSAKARRVIDEASPFSDSGLETYVVPRLKWMKLRIVPQAWIAGHRVDFLIGERLVLQIDGGHHVGRQRASDNAHDAVLRLMGYHPIRVGYFQVIEDWPGVQSLIMQAVARGLHIAH